MNTVLYFDKPLGWTSFNLVNRVRGVLSRHIGVKKLKVGHAGTLDPLATGVMILCTGKNTKLIESFQYQTKEYVATIKLGATTPSFDLETEIDAEYPVEHITEDLVKQTLNKFIGEIKQIPPTYSAIKINGKRAYEYARKGIKLELPAKTVKIYDIKVLDGENNKFKFEITCGAGTYIRAIARDIASALNTYGYMNSLIRTNSGQFSIENAVPNLYVDSEYNIHKYSFICLLNKCL